MRCVFPWGLSGVWDWKVRIKEHVWHTLEHIEMTFMIELYCLYLCKTASDILDMLGVVVGYRRVSDLALLLWTLNMSSVA